MKRGYGETINHEDKLKTHIMYDKFYVLTDSQNINENWVGISRGLYKNMRKKIICLISSL